MPQLSDTERRVLGHLRAPHDEDGAPFTDEQIVERVEADQHTAAEGDQVLETLKDVEAMGCCRRRKDGWRMTKAGLEALRG